MSRIRTARKGAGVFALGMLLIPGWGWAGDRGIQEVVDEFLARMNERKKVFDRDVLEDFSDEQVIPAIISALNRRPGYEADEPRIFAYRELARRNAVQSEMGFRQLIECVSSDPVAADICAEALLDAPEEKHAQILDVIRRYLETARRPPELRRWIRSDVEEVILRIGKKGQEAHGYIGILDEIVHDPERRVEVRAAAAWAILQTEPLGEGLERFQGLDAAGLGGAIAAVGGRIAQLRAEADKARIPYSKVYDEHRADIEAARGLLLEALQSPRPETQAAALEPMGLVYRNDIMIVRSEDDYELNPELRPLLEDIAHEHPDEGVRQRFASILDPSIQRRMAQRILEIREREREAEQKDE